MSKKFARIIKSTSGQEVLFFVEPENGSFSLHQVIQLHDIPGEPQVDIKIGFTSSDPEKNERDAYGALEMTTNDYADKLIARASEIVNGMLEENENEH